VLRRLGNPLRTEAAAFRWLLVIAGAFAVAMVVIVAARAIL
jgi:hypothetical protein